MLRMASRTDCSDKEAAIIRISAILLAFLFAAFFIALLGHNPLSVYSSMIEGAFGTVYRIKETIIKAIPLIITSLGISLAFKLKFWNIGAEGQIMMGAIGATFCALTLKDVPPYILLPLMGAGSIICGGIWGAIPAFFRAKFKTNETIFTLMMNYISLKFLTYLQYGPWKDPEALGFPKIQGFAQNAILPTLFGIHIGWIISLILIVIMYSFINHTKIGYEINVVGESENTARYAGINVKAIIIYTIFLSGGLCGLAGMIEVSGVDKTLSVEITHGVGYTAIITSWLSSLRAPVIAIVCILFAALVQSGTFIQMAFQIPQSAAQILQGMILFFVLGSEFFIRYKLSYIRKKKVEEL
ncbi:MAG: ABC transporter permease [Spirochaetes bacterium]|nr:ABC transporter permease [Spirochaetota bacterium]